MTIDIEGVNHIASPILSPQVFCILVGSHRHSDLDRLFQDQGHGLSMELGQLAEGKLY
jgi:hypothetical protein